MARLRKTLPKNFDETVAGGDPDAIIDILKKCEPDARYGAYDDRTALMNPMLPDAVVRWLVTEYGADVNCVCEDGKTPLSAAVRRPEAMERLVALGADVNFQRDGSPTALIAAAMVFRADSVRELLRLGADAHMTFSPGFGRERRNALEEALARCANANLPQMAELAEVLLDAGVESTDGMKRQVTRLGEQFEFYRDSFDPGYLPVCDAALQKLYSLFDVPPVPPRQKYDGSAPITVKGKTWVQQYHELWDRLVPGSGRAAYVQGEAIRLIGRLSHEVLDNGGANWDADFRAMRDTLADILATGQPAAESVRASVRSISAGTEEKTFSEIARAVVAWILANPMPVALGDVPYRR